MIAEPDIFTNVHKGIRSALFHACAALGRAGADPERSALARAALRGALHFVAHHGDNEDVLLLPLLAGRVPAVVLALEEAHAALSRELENLRAAVDTAPTTELYLQTSRFVALYLEHMQREEQELEPLIRAAVPREELATVGPRSVARTAPEDQRFMLSWMIRAMPAIEAEAFLAKVPEQWRAELRAFAAA